MQIVSVNVGQPREVRWKQQIVSTGIFKAPVSGRVMVRALNIDGDRQADLTVHGGSDKAVYAYPAEHYDFWRQELPDHELPWGAFGENLTVLGLDEQTVSLGDQFRIGAVLLEATQPRVPCYKLGIRFGRDDMVKRFLDAARPGIYFAVLHEGEIGAGDTIEHSRRDPHGISIAELARLYVPAQRDPELMRRAVAHPSLPDVWRGFLSDQLAKLVAPQG